MKIETINVSVVRVVDGNDTWIIHQSHGVDKVSYIAIHQNGEKREPYIIEGDDGIIRMFNQGVLDELKHKFI
jgi:hypothetical protein